MHRASDVPRRLTFRTLLLFLAANLVVATRPAAAAEPIPERLRPAGIDGTLVLCGSPHTPDSVLDRFVKLAGGDKANLLVITLGGSTDKLVESWQARKPATVTIEDFRAAKDDTEALVTKLDKATGLWIGMNDNVALKKFLMQPQIEPAVRKLLKRGGVLGIDGCGCGVVGKPLTDDNADKKKPDCLDVLPGTVLRPLFTKGDKEAADGMFEVLDQYPGLVGFGIDKETALIVQGRELRVLGNSVVTVCLAGSKTRKPLTIELKPSDKGEAVHDLTALRRAAIARAEPPFPPKEAATPNVPSGSLVIVGGGGMPPDVTKKFIDLAGGPEALIVVLPQANPDPMPSKPSPLFERAGAKNVQLLRGRDLKEIDSPENLEMLKKAKAIWFDGGRQWRFVDAFEGTKALELIRDVLKNGGVIGGSSAGASIQSEYMPRGSPLGNFEMMSEGYEHGLGFLPGVAVDQHFTQRKRFNDMTALVKAYPQLLGIGLDEATAIVVAGSTAEVMGKGHVHFYDRNKPVEDGKPDYEALQAGDRYDLKARKILPTEKAK
jgi:cyanophycinase